MNEWLKLLQNSDYIGIKKYIESGADVNEHNESGESVLALSLRYRCGDDVVMQLVENGAKLDDFDEEGVSIFDNAITYNNFTLFTYMVENGIDVNNTKRKSRFTPLMGAVCYSRVEMVKLLLKYGADKNRTDEKGLSVFDFARKMNKSTILKMLEENNHEQ